MEEIYFTPTTSSENGAWFFNHRNEFLLDQYNLEASQESKEQLL